MTADEQFYGLCHRILEEEDPAAFALLLAQMSDLLQVNASGENADAAESRAES
jgi:hypothetical protein